YADAVGATPGLRYWWRLGEQAPAGGLATLVDRVEGATGGYYGVVGVPGVVDDGDTAYESDPLFPTFDHYLAFGIPNDLFHQAFTFEAWYRPEDSGSQRALFHDDFNGYLDGVALLREADDSLRAIIASRDDTRSVDLRTAPLSMAPGSWHHVVLTRADDRVAIYVDGVARAQAPATPVTFAATSYSIGVGSRLNAYRGWVGGIDEVSIYDRPLDAATVDAHFRAGDDGLAPLARADPPVSGVQPRSGVIHLTADRAGSSFRCSLDGSPFAGCRPDYLLEPIADGPHELRVLATSRTGVSQVSPTLLRFTIDAKVPGTVLALRIAPESDGRAIVTFGSSGETGFQCRDLRGLGAVGERFRSCRAPMDVAPGTNLEVRAVDASGNADPTPAFAQVPPAGKGFGFGSTLPTFAGARPEARLSGEFSFAPDYQCKVDARDWASCPSEYRLPILDPGTHTMQVRQPYGSPRVTATAPPMVWTVAPRPGDVAIAGLQMQLVIERSARLLRRSPRVRFALSHPAAVSVDVLGRGRRRAIHVALKGATGPNIVKISARRLRALRHGRYSVRVVARGASGRTTAQELPLAIVPPLR
ncbi:MAG: large repetitive protein, partial [Solirubrobacteraceae bacterium]|nr:large repetitive protein [Solirubrobacteraceae bacterium]